MWSSSPKWKATRTPWRRDCRTPTRVASGTPWWSWPKERSGTRRPWPATLPTTATGSASSCGPRFSGTCSAAADQARSTGCWPVAPPRPEGGGRRVAQLAELELPDLVGERLAGVHDVAVHLDDDVLLSLRCVVLEEVDRLLARPPHRVNPGVEHETHGAPHFVGELAELGVRVLIHAELGPEALGVEPPALDERGVATVPAELGQAVQLLGQRDLQVVAGHRLVQAERFHLPLGP